MVKQGYNRFICTVDWEGGLLNVSWNDIRDALIDGLDVIILPKPYAAAFPAVYGDDEYTYGTLHFHSLGIGQDDGNDVYYASFYDVYSPGGGDPNEIVLYPFAAPTPDDLLVSVL